MTPRGYYDAYRNLQVPVPGTAFTVDIHEYRNNSSDRSGDHGTGAGLTAYRDLVRAMRRYANRDAHDASVFERRHRFDDGSQGRWFDLTFPAIGRVTIQQTDLQRCFVGKGSPELIATALQLVVGLGIAARPDQLQSYAGENIGLDCSGFVGCYCQAEGLSRPYYNTPSRSFKDFGTKLDDTGAIRAKSILCWKDHGHVAIVNRVVSGPTSGVVECEVVESCGSSFFRGNIHTDGLNATVYSIKRAGEENVFMAKRQFPRHPLDIAGPEGVNVRDESWQREFQRNQRGEDISPLLSPDTRRHRVREFVGGWMKVYITNLINS